MITKLFEDANNKVGKHIAKNKYWQKIGIEVDRSHRLLVGDYMLAIDGDVSVDTKKDLQELVTNLFCDRFRFEKECIKAKNNGILLFILIEEQFDKEQLLNWKSKTNSKGIPYVKVAGWQILSEMKRYAKLYGVKFRCCHKLATGKMVLELLDKKN